jgi:hypothetical protein
MTLADQVRLAVSKANLATADLQVDVIHEVWIGDDVRGQPEYAPPIVRKAIVDKSGQIIRNPTGEMEESTAYIAFIYPVEVDRKDKLTLPDGTTGPIMKTGGFFDAGTGHPYYAEVWLGHQQQT